MCEVVKFYSDKQKCQGIFNKTLDEMLTYVLGKKKFLLRKCKGNVMFFCAISVIDKISFGEITKETIFQFHSIPEC